MIAAANKETKLSKSGKPFDAYRVILPMFNEAVYAIQEGVVDPADVDIAMQNGCGFKRGLMTIANEKGLEWVLAELNSYLYADQNQPNERFRASWLIHKLVGAKVSDFSALGKKPVAVG